MIAIAITFGSSAFVFCDEVYIGQKRYRFRYERVESSEKPTYVVKQNNYRNPLVVGFKINPDGTISAKREKTKAVFREKSSPAPKPVVVPKPAEAPKLVNLPAPVSVVANTATEKPISLPAQKASKTEPTVEIAPRYNSSKIRVFTVNFDLGSSQIRPEAKNTLNRVSTIYSKREFEVVGFTCPLGSKKRNKQVAEARAKAVADILTVNDSTIAEAIGKPQCCYISKTELWKNRRVEIYLKR